MKFEESSLTGYLVNNLKPLTEADPVILAEYVVTLLKKDKPTKELQKLCTENLVEFLGNDSKSFVAKLFQALQDGLILSSTKRQESIKKAEPSPALVTVDSVRQGSLSPNLEKLSSSSGLVTDREEKEVSDDDDDDRNHKHRRRGTQSMSSDKDTQENFFRRQSRRIDKPFENGQSFLGNDPQTSVNRKLYNIAPLEGAKFEKRRAGLAPLSHTPLDLGQRTRVSQTIHSDAGPHFDLSTSLVRLPIGRGRGRNNPLWNQHDSIFGSVEASDFSPQMPSQVINPPSLFAGRGIPDAAATHSGAWGAFGLIHGVPNGGLDTFHPLGLQGTLRPAVSPLIGIPRQRCRDFEERGFCLRGDMCPMEHGLNRIVVEDVQSLSQFNLPVLIPRARIAGGQGGSGPFPPVTSSPSTLTNSKGLRGKISMLGVNDDSSGLNGTVPGSADAGEADLYDPDEPLWNNNHPETTGALLRFTSPKLGDTELLLDAGTTDRHSFGSADGNDSEHLGRSLATNVGSQNTSSSIWGRIGKSGNRLEVASKIDSTVSATSYQGNERKEDQEETLNNICGTSQQGKWASTGEIGPQTKNLFSTPKQCTDSGRHICRASQKALCTLFVRGIPLKNNKKEALHSHFKKFGEVIDIYIPVNSEKAFVQFSKREEAEAALRAPDAVMGNRFIKLWWANRDTIPDYGGCGSVASVPSCGTITASVPSHPSIEIRKENNPSAIPKSGTIPVFDATIPAPIPPRFAVTNGPKAAPPSQKKLETLELLKEELRKKQEMLDQKRNDFRHQLDKLEKQAITVKGEKVLEQAVKRRKVDALTDVVKSPTPRHTNPVATAALLEAEMTPDKKTSGDDIVSSSAKPNYTALQHSPRSLKQPIHLPTSGGSHFLANRFKLDNRPTSFRILPPLPDDVANVSVLREHFSSFGDLLRVELEDPEANGGGPGSEPSQKFSARITFVTLGSAQRAFLNGKCLRGHNVDFAWLTTISNCSTDHGSIEIPPAVKGPADAEIPVEAYLTNGKSMCSAISEPPAAAGNRVPASIDGSPECILKGSGSSLPHQVIE